MSSSPGTLNQQLAAVVRGVMAGRANLDPWLEFPQSTCCFVFGPQKSPVPIGALYRLWDSGPPWRQPCRGCGGDLRSFACGGLLSACWFTQVCIDCEHSLTETRDGGIGSAADSLRPLADTQFRMTGGSFGGTYSSTGRELLRLLDLRYRARGDVRFEVGGQPSGSDFKAIPRRRDSKPLKQTRSGRRSAIVGKVTTSRRGK